MKSRTEDLDRVRRLVPPETWAERVAVADRLAAVADRIESRIAGGEPERHAIRAEAPDDAETTWVARLRRYRADGRDGLVDRRAPKKPPKKLTPGLLATVRGLLAGRPELTSPQVQERLLALDINVSGTVVKRAMKELGLAWPQGNPGHRRVQQVEPLDLAGAELLLGLDQVVGATSALAAELQAGLAALPPPSEPVRDDRANRDGRGRFKPAYNAAKKRTVPELGEKFDSVEQRRQGKNLPAMRTAQSSKASLSRKVVALTMLPCATDSARLDALGHWQGGAFEALVGVGYMPATLDKFARELKYAGMAQAAQDAVASFWLGRPSLLGEAPVQGAAVVYVDTSVSPLWTHHFSRCAKVARLGGRIMPATSTVFLHAGCGTPVLYKTWSGQVSLGAAVEDLLDRYEALGGDDTVQRLIVMDREAHAAWLFKALRDRAWDFIVPLKKSVVSDPDRFSKLTDWAPYGGRGDEIRGGRLQLNDSKDRSDPMEVRVVGRRRHRTGKVAWYATLVEAEAFSDTAIIDLYFKRWPLQEHVFRDGNGRVHLDAHHGYGRQKVDNVAVLDRLDKLEGQARLMEARIEQGQTVAAAARVKATETAAAIAPVVRRIDVLRRELDVHVQRGEADTFLEKYATVRTLEDWVAPRLVAARAAEAAFAEAERAGEQARRRLDANEQDRLRLEKQRQVFTIDVELDQIMTAFKLTFMNLCGVFMTDYLGCQMQLDTLIRSVLTLPGERVRTATTETVRIWRQPRDRKVMPLVELACQRLNAKGLRRGERVLRFELADRPEVERPVADDSA